MHGLFTIRGACKALQSKPGLMDIGGFGPGKQPRSPHGLNREFFDQFFQGFFNGDSAEDG
jgi:hypothetical protein